MLPVPPGRWLLVVCEFRVLLFDLRSRELRDLSPRNLDKPLTDACVLFSSGGGLPFLQGPLGEPRGLGEPRPRSCSPNLCCPGQSHWAFQRVLGRRVGASNRSALTPAQCWRPASTAARTFCPCRGCAQSGTARPRARVPASRAWPLRPRESASGPIMSWSVARTGRCTW